MRPDRVIALVPAHLWDADGGEIHAELRLTLDDDSPDVPVAVDCRLVGAGDGDDWIMNVERDALMRALAICDSEREAVAANG